MLPHLKSFQEPTQDTLNELLIKKKDKVRTCDEEIKDLWTLLDLADKKIAPKDFRIQELIEYGDECYTVCYSSAQLELLRLFRDDKLENKGLKAKILDLAKCFGEVEEANDEMRDYEKRPKNTSGQRIDED